MAAKIDYKWKVFAQDPESEDDQGIYVKHVEDTEPWQTETDCEEFDAFHNPSEEGWSVRDLESAKRWAEGFYLGGEVVKFEVI